MLYMTCEKRRKIESGDCVINVITAQNMVTALRNDTMKQALAIKRSNNMRRNHKKYKFIRVNKAMEHVILANPPVDLLFIIQLH